MQDIEERKKGYEETLQQVEHLQVCIATYPYEISRLLQLCVIVSSLLQGCIIIVALCITLYNVVQGCALVVQSCMINFIPQVKFYSLEGL